MFTKENGFTLIKNMRIAVLSDIHGNAFALQAVLDDLQQRQVDLCVNLGDIFYGPIAPRATYDLLMDHDLVTIRGNQDRQIYATTPVEIDTNPTLRFVVEDLGSEPVEWLQSLPFDRHMDPDIYLCHGTPTDDATYLLEDVAGGSPILRTNNKIIASLNGETAALILCGHSHLPQMVRLSSGQKVVNPGSVGLPAYSDETPHPHAIENQSPHAAYAIIEKEHGDRDGWIIDHIKVPYEYEQAVAAAQKRGCDDWACFLETGKAGPLGPKTVK